MTDSRSRNSPPPNRRATWLCVVAVACALYFLMSWWLRPTLADDARRLVEAKLENRPEVIYDYVFDYQIEQTGITRDQFVQVWHRLIAPRMARWKPVGKIQAEVYRGDHQGVAYILLRDDEGHEMDLQTSAWNTGLGGGQRMFQDLTMAWWSEYIFSKGLDPNDTELKISASLRGLREDRPVLEAIGIRRIPGAEPGMPPVTLDEWQRRLERLLDQVRESKRIRQEKEASSTNTRIVR